MLKTLVKQIKEYKLAAILAPVFVSCEVLLEVLIPYISSRIIDDGISQGNIQSVAFYGTIMIIFALLSLCFGVAAGVMSAKASTGFAKNLRQTIFKKIQSFSFANIDKFNPASLITRLTTDITNVQNAFQMTIRIAVRCPLMLICSMIMAFLINPSLSMIFLIAIIVLIAFLTILMIYVTPIFHKVFSSYDYLNESVQQNVTSIRVVKSFNREKFENEKFVKAANRLYKFSVKAENIIATSFPVMFATVFACILTIS